MSKTSSTLSGGLGGAGAGAQIGAKFGPYGALVGGGLGLLLGGAGGFFDDSDEEAAKLEREKLAEQRREFELNLLQRQKEATAQQAFQGLGHLANMRAEANSMTRKYNFKNALYNAARGA